MDKNTIYNLLGVQGGRLGNGLEYVFQSALNYLHDQYHTYDSDLPEFDPELNAELLADLKHYERLCEEAGYDLPEGFISGKDVA